MTNKRSVSLKKNLIITLSSLLSVALILVFLVGFFSAKNEVAEVFDADLVKSAKLIFGLIRHEILEEEDKNKNDFELDLTIAEQQKIFHRYEYKIHSQIWKGSRLIYSSRKNSLAEKPDYTGFKDVTFDGTQWRAFVLNDEKSDITILVMEKEAIREELADEIAFSMFLPLIFSFIPLFLIVIFTIKKRLQPLDRIADEISEMSSKSLKSLQDNDAPLELRPVIESFNSLVEKLNQSMESERRFTDYAAHELKTPLAAITIQAQLLEKTKDRVKQQEYLHDLIDGIERMSHMVNQLLTLVRLEPENNQIEREDFSLRNTIEKLLEDYAAEIAKHRMRIDHVFERNSGKLIINANKTYIEIMIRNLIDNAIKYSPDGGVISINISRKNDHANLKIVNQGAVISEGDKQKIFNNFYRANIEINKDKSGCGLGLAIVKKIADLHGASISFESENGVNVIQVSFR